MRRIVVTGSECTGKTTLARALAHHYDTLWVPEYARRFVALKGVPVVAADVDTIARGQIALEEETIAAAVAASIRADLGRDLLIQDTDLLSTIVYSRHYYGSCPGWVEAAFQERRADLYLLAGIDVPWVADGDQRDRGDRREEMQDLFRRALVDNGCRSTEVAGSVATRIELAVREIERSRLPVDRHA